MRKINKLKYSVLLLAFITLFVGVTTAQQKKQIQISGKVQFLNPDFFKKYNAVWLIKGVGKNAKTVDSTAINADGSFRFTVETEPALYQLDVVKWQTVSFWADDNIFVNCRGYDTARIKARKSCFISVESRSEANRLINTAMYGKYLDKMLLDEVLAEGFAAQRALSTDSTWYKAYRKQGLYRQIESQSDARIKGMIQNEPNNPATVYLLSLLDRKYNVDYVLAVLDKQLATNPNFEEAKQLKKEILEEQALAKITQSGSLIPNIAYPGVDGKTIALSSFKGKYVILDFWASWCGPCRKSIPKLKDLYSLYKSKGLEILSVSIDTDDNAWRKAMSDEAMPWPQVLSPNKDKTMKDFSIQGVPTLFLIDRKGRIVEKFTGYNAKMETMLKAML